MSKYAVIDIGTNSMRMMIAQTINDHIVNKKKYIITTRIGQNVDKKRQLTNESIERNYNALKEFKEIGDKERVDNYIVFGTSALRDAENRDAFIKHIKETLGLEIKVITGKEEALYGFAGVSSSYPNKKLIMMDIGGGSTEIVEGNDCNIDFCKSMDIGAVRLTEKFIHSDPSNTNEIQKLISYIREILINNLERNSNDVLLIGIGGTATTIASVNLCLEKYDSDIVHNSIVEITELKTIINKFQKSEDFQRKKIIGLHPDRSDIILAGSLIAYEIMNYYNISSFQVSENDNLEGALLYRLKQIHI